MILAGDIGGTHTRLAFFELDSHRLAEVEVYPSRDYESLDEIHWERTCYRPFPSEGGHADFAPRNRTEAQLLFFLMKEYPLRKGRLSPLLEQVPVKLIRDDRCALYGAARLARVGVGKC